MSSKTKTRKGVRGSMRELGREIRDIFWSPSPPPSNPASRSSSFSIKSYRTGRTRSLRSLTPSQLSDPSYSPLEDAKPAGRAVWGGLGLALQALEQSSDVCPPLKSATSGLLSCLDILRVSAEGRRDYDELASRLTILVNDLQNRISQSKMLQMSDSVLSVVSGLEWQVTYINEKRNRWGPRWYAEAAQDADDLLACYRRIEMLFQQLQSNALMNVWSIADQHLANTRLESMQPAKQARYDSAVAAVVRRRECTPNTRKAVLQGLRDWKDDTDGAKIYWMNGMAGTGKTTIAYTLCSELEATHQLVASFFCSRELPDCRDPTRIVPTLAYQLARFSYPFQTVLCRILGNDPDLSTRDITTQFRRLISEPLQEIKGTLSAGMLVVVIDALDECSDHVGVQLFLKALFVSVGASPIKFFIACRPEPGLYLRSLHGGSHSVLHLHDIEQSVVQGDIETYLSTELEELPTDQVRQLAERSGTLFIFAATVVRYVKPNHASIIWHERLETILGARWSSGSKAYDSIDTLYGTILSAALSQDELEPAELETGRQVLHTVICAKEPMTIQAMACLLDVAAGKVERTVERLRSVLYVAEGTSLVSPLHASFHDYMLNQERSKDFFCHAETHHQLLAIRCFELMNRLLRFNICNLESSYLLDADAQYLAERINDAIPSHLLYACCHWTDHLYETGAEAGLIVPLEAFLTKGVLFWLEVLSLKKCIYVGLMMLPRAHKWLREHNAPSGVCRLAKDAYKFATVVGANVVCNSTPHIYISVLAFWNREDPMWTNYGMRTQGLVQAGGVFHVNKPSAVLAIWNAGESVGSIAISLDGSRVVSGAGKDVIMWDAYTGNRVFSLHRGHQDLVTSVAISSDGRFIASGSRDCTIHIYDAHTGDVIVGPLKGHTGWVRSVALSPNGARVMSGSDDQTIRIWDRRTGRLLVGPLEGHAGGVLSVAFSPDGGCIASGSADCTIRIWDAQTGGIFVQTLEGHTGAINSVAFSPDSARIASGSSDRTIRIWDVRSGDVLVGPLNGHTGGIKSVMFSLGGTRIVSGSFDRTIYIWNAQSGDALAGPLYGHTDTVCSVSFSPYGDQIVSGSDDCTIRIWDVHAGSLPARPREGHADSVLSVAFSPDSSRVISGSADNVICIWNAHTGNILADQLRGHTDWVRSVVVSPDSAYIASGSSDRTIRIWDAQTGDMLLGPLRGHTDSITSVNFSPSGRRIVSGSYDCTIRIWDAQAGIVLVGPLKGHVNLVHSVAFSPDGALVASGSEDRTVRIWDARNGNMLVGPLRGHSGKVSSITFSPNGKHVISGSGDCTLCIWDVQTGNMLAPPFKGHTDCINSVAFSPSGRCIVSGSDDCTIRIWDAQTGSTLAGPFKAHTTGVCSVAFSPDGDCVASGSWDGSIFMWRLRGSDYSTSDAIGEWAIHDNGWVVGRNSARLLWLSPGLRTRFERTKPIVIYDRWPLGIDFDTAAIGTRWRSCFQE